MVLITPLQIQNIYKVAKFLKLTIFHFYWDWLCGTFVWKNIRKEFLRQAKFILCASFSYYLLLYYFNYVYLWSNMVALWKYVICTQQVSWYLYFKNFIWWFDWHINNVHIYEFSAMFHCMCGFSCWPNECICNFHSIIITCFFFYFLWAFLINNNFCYKTKKIIILILHFDQ